MNQNKYLILYIEDNPANLRLVECIFMKRDNIDLICANEPEEGLELAASQQPDIILLDINLPRIDGYELLKRLREGEKNQNTLVMALSANAMASDIHKGTQAGFYQYITKPLDIPKFLTCIDEAISHLK